MTDFLERLIEEEKELDKKVSSLCCALESDGFKEKVGEYQHNLLSLQCNTMLTYRRILIMRIDDLQSKS
jgi:hypothetical protein